MRRLTAGSRRGLFAAALLLLAGALAVELIARSAFGLGDPPLFVADPEIEYLPQPSREYRRFGHRVAYNRWSMRSDDFPVRKASPDERRVLVIGDSVIEGGTLTDQADLATEHLRRRLHAALGRPVVVGNISASSWGPPNQLAYVRRNGLFEADVVVLVLSSHDYADVPTGASPVGVQPSLPDRAPRWATQELLTRYLPNLPHYLGWRAEPADPPATPTGEHIAQALGALATLIQVARDRGAAVLVVQHWERRELQQGLLPGHAAIAQVAHRLGVPTVQLGPAFARAEADGRRPYRDYIHPSPAGQQVIAEALLGPLRQRLAAAEGSL